MPNRFASLASLQSLAALAILAALAVAGPAEAKPKKIVSNGCTVEQIQSPAAGQCIDKMQDDIMHNRPTFHALYCSSTGRMLCCQYDQAGNTVDHSCEILNMSRPKHDVLAPNTGTIAPESLVQSGGGDGNAAAPPPGGIFLY